MHNPLGWRKFNQATILNLMSPPGFPVSSLLGSHCLVCSHRSHVTLLRWKIIRLLRSFDLNGLLMQKFHWRDKRHANPHQQPILDEDLFSGRPDDEARVRETKNFPMRLCTSKQQTKSFVWHFINECLLTYLCWIPLKMVDTKPLILTPSVSP